MRRTPLARTLIALWGVWFSVALVEPAGVMACAMHMGTGDHSAHAAPAAAPAHDMAAMHHEVAAEGGAESTGTTDAPAPDAHTQCTCLDSCCSVVPVIPATGHDPLAHVPVAVRRSRPSATVERAESARAFALPFANGPPTLA
jgi:hypothetical protein